MSNDPLTAKHCVPCEGGMPPLEPAVAEKLLAELRASSRFPSRIETNQADARQSEAENPYRVTTAPKHPAVAAQLGQLQISEGGSGTSSDHDWALVDGKVTKQFGFKNFVDAVAFINQIATIAEGEGHHPDVNLHDYRLVTISLITHAIHGLSENDFILASKIQVAYDQLS